MSKYLSPKAFIVILVLSLVVTYGMAFVDDIISPTKNPTGLPFGFASFNFLGGSTNGLMFILDIAFWFIVIWVLWRVLQKVTSTK